MQRHVVLCFQLTEGLIRWDSGNMKPDHFYLLTLICFSLLERSIFHVR